MRSLDYKTEYQKLLSPEIVSYLAQIHEQKGLQILFLGAEKDALAERKALLAEDSKYVQAIKDAKNFPRVMNIDLSEEYKLNKVDDPYGYIETVQSEE